MGCTGIPLKEQTLEEQCRVEVKITVVPLAWQQKLGDLPPEVRPCTTPGWGVIGERQMFLHITQENAMQLIVDAIAAIRHYRREHGQPSGYAPVLGTLLQKVIAGDRAKEMQKQKPTPQV